MVDWARKHAFDLGPGLVAARLEVVVFLAAAFGVSPTAELVGQLGLPSEFERNNETRRPLTGTMLCDPGPGDGGDVEDSAVVVFSAFWIFFIHGFAGERARS